MSSYHNTEVNGQLFWGDERLELVFDRASGRWLAMRDLATGENVLHHGAQQAPVLLQVNGVTTATLDRAHCRSVVDAETIGIHTICTRYECAQTDRGPTLTLHTQEGNWLLEQRYTLARNAARIERGLRIEYQGQAPALLREVELRLPPAILGPVSECYAEAPCCPTKAHQPLAGLPVGEYWDRVKAGLGDAAPGWYPGLFAVDNPSRNLALAVWIFSEVESADVRVMREDHGTRIGHLVNLADRFEHGHAIEWRGQYLQLSHKPWLEALADYQAWLEEIGYHAAPNRPEWAHRARIYELFIGYAPKRYSVHKFPQMDTLAADLPRIKALGFNTIEIMPQMPFPAYSIVDFYDVDTHYGSAEGLRKVVARAHELGMKVMLDVILHGVMDREALRARERVVGHLMHLFLDDPRLVEKHPYRVEHPEWFIQTEFGTPSGTYTWGFDHCNESWRAFMVEVFCHYVREFDVDGFRVDALQWMPIPNWAKGLPYRASAPLCGSRALSERVRRAVHAIKPDAAFYTETPGTLYQRAYDMVYNYDVQWLFSSLLTPISPRGFAYTLAVATERITAADVGPWLEQQRLSKPKGAMTVHHLDSHDSNEWGGLAQYRREAFGEQASKALFGFCCSLGGPLMMFQGAEDGAEGFYTQMLRLVNELPALRDGSIDFTAITASDVNVFVPLRLYGRHTVVPVIHFADCSIQVTLSLPVERLPLQGGTYRLVDRMDDTVLPGPVGDGWTSEQMRNLVVPLGPYQVRMLEIVDV